MEQPAPKWRFYVPVLNHSIPISAIPFSKLRVQKLGIERARVTDEKSSKKL